MAANALATGDPADPELGACAETAAQDAKPVEDANGSVDYKRQLVRVMVGRTVREALAQALGDQAVPAGGIDPE